MNISRKLGFCLVFAVFLAFLPLSVSAEGGRFFVKSTKGFWKNAFGVRHNFENGFSSDLSEFQIRFAKMFGIEIEPIQALQILPASETIEPTASPTITPATLPSLNNISRSKKDNRLTPSDRTPWGIESIYDDSNIASTSGGFGVKVAILDTGVDVKHPDMSRRIEQCKDFTLIRTPVVDGRCEDKNGHGTHVAGIIAADGGVDNLGIYGVAPEAKIFAYKVCDLSGTCYADDIAVGIRMATDKGANVINMSFGTEDDIPLIRDAVSYASGKGVLMIAAAGNDGPLEGSIDYPAAYASVVAVGAINKENKVTPWSSRGINSETEFGVINNGDIEFVAPGEYIESTWNNNGYVILSGTSMASPFVSGLIAKYWQVKSEKPAEDTRILLRSMANLLPNYSFDSNSTGYGLPQVEK